MLKFIELQQKLDSREVAFQNILCWSLSRKGSKNERKHKCISKHLMLKFIVSATHWLKAKYLFQNILCWSLSWSRLRYRKWKTYFKTSYVEVYLPRSIRFRLNNLNFKTSYVEVYRSKLFHVSDCSVEFQNILCWSLSILGGADPGNLTVFQNILCWSLSIQYRK